MNARRFCKLRVLTFCVLQVLTRPQPWPHLDAEATQPPRLAHTCKYLVWKRSVETCYRTPGIRSLLVVFVDFTLPRCLRCLTPSQPPEGKSNSSLRFASPSSIDFRLTILRSSALSVVPQRNCHAPSSSSCVTINTGWPSSTCSVVNAATSGGSLKSQWLLMNPFAFSVSLRMAHV